MTQEYIAPPDTRFLSELHAELDRLILESSELILGPSISIILEKPQLVSVEKCGNKSSLHFTVQLREPGHASVSGLRVSFVVSMWRRF